MDALVNSLLQLGIGGIMAAAVIIYGWVMATRTIPQLLTQRDADVAWARNQIDQKRTQFLEEIQAQRKDLLAALDKVQKDSQLALTQVMEHCDKEVAHLSLSLSKEIDRLGSSIGQLTIAVNDLRKERGNHA